MINKWRKKHFGLFEKMYTVQNCLGSITADYSHVGLIDCCYFFKNNLHKVSDVDAGHCVKPRKLDRRG